MSDIANRYRRLSDAFTEKVRGVPADRWDDASPCQGWTASDVVQHVTDTQGMFLGFIGREIPTAPSFGDAARAPGVFGPQLDAAPEADAQTRLLALVGRRA